MNAWTVAFQAPLSMGFSRQEYWRGLPVPSPGELPGSGIDPGSLVLQEDSLLTELRGKANKYLLSSFILCAKICIYVYIYISMSGAADKLLFYPLVPLLDYQD